MSDIVYRTSGPWGPASAGDADLTAHQVDTNFWILYSLILALQDATPDTIAYFTVTGDNMWITMTDHTVFGPFTIPTAVFNFRGAWLPNVSYAVNDIFTVNGAVYMCIYPQTDSGSTFYDLANDGKGHNFYGLLLAAAYPFPANGIPGQVLQWTTLNSPGGVAWAYINRPIAIFLGTAPDPMELICRYKFVEKTQFPVGLTGSVGGAATPCTTTQQYELYQNGANIGTVTFDPSPPDSASFTFPNQITFEPNDVLTIVAPTMPDPHMTGICITLLGKMLL